MTPWYPNWISDSQDNNVATSSERPAQLQAEVRAGSTGGAGSVNPVPRNPGDPVFDNNLVTNVTVQMGATAFLHCRVRNLGERPVSYWFRQRFYSLFHWSHQVSWVRRRDWHILTSGMFTYTNDERFQVSHSEGGDDWDLQIKYVQKRDNGTYECQVRRLLCHH